VNILFTATGDHCSKNSFQFQLTIAVAQLHARLVQSDGGDEREGRTSCAMAVQAFSSPEPRPAPVEFALGWVWLSA